MQIDIIFSIQFTLIIYESIFEMLFIILSIAFGLSENNVKAFSSMNILFQIMCHLFKHIY